MTSTTQVLRTISTRLAGLAAIALVCAGCASDRVTLGHWDGPAEPAVVTRAGWDHPGTPAAVAARGETLMTPHYRVFTTVDEGPARRMLPQVMEGAYAEYRKLVPDVPTSDRAMDCYVFGKRGEWSEFTRANTGADAVIYLQITRGGYTVGDRFAVYYIGDYATYSVASHEGWHQFVARHFKGRIAPFLEEGLATTFESLQWDNGRPRWNRSVNVSRAQALRRAMDYGYTFPLEQLVGMHAGQVVDKSGEKISAFYAQAWAFARFLWEGDGGRYRPALQRLLGDTARGTVDDPTSAQRDVAAAWRPGSVRPVLEKYLGMPWPEIDRRYRAYMRTAAYDEFSGQFQS